ncbi:hypothetical protein [Gloeothece verrucosa]|uniref:Uncharacterized protein n=1 Tax=Gloeothece verrucosa (strain PCC 7822) TaxID=497965 RepID=E0U8Q4_GLOV7|nr:hypothetical protein [Gloeothece verrucosa]ADN14918.1 hypothetical protein Cyan7822_2961 [Gloeothece verrucosa PCC 7822]
MENIASELISLKKCVAPSKNNLTYFDITIRAASEIQFSLTANGVDVNLLIFKLCQVIPSIISYDMTMAEIADGARGVSIDPECVKNIRKFKNFYERKFLEPLEICD